MTDIVEGLRDRTFPLDQRDRWKIADEIERLRAECLRLSHAEAEAMAVVLSLEEQVGKLRADAARWHFCRSHWGQLVSVKSLDGECNVIEEMRLSVNLATVTPESVDAALDALRANHDNALKP